MVDMKNTNVTAYKKKIKDILEVLLCPYEDEKLAFYMKLVFGFIWAVSIPNGMYMGDGSDYIEALVSMVLVLSANILISKKYKQWWIDVVTFWILCAPVYYVFCDACVGYFSIIFLLMYGCGIIFILGIKDSLAINIASLLLIFINFRFDADSVVRARYGENIALRFPYLFICIVVIVYCLMYLIQRYWVQKNKRTQILEQRIFEERQKLDEMSMKVMNTMVCALDAKIPSKEAHCRAVAKYAGKIAAQKKLDKVCCEAAYNAGLLHEIGMIGIPDELIQRTDLTDEEYQIFKGYVEKGYQIVSTLQSEEMQEVAETVRYHRECYDGSGFPEGLLGEEIPPLARILAVADYTDRHLRRGESVESVIQSLSSLSGIKFEPESTKIMVQILEQMLV